MIKTLIIDQFTSQCSRGYNARVIDRKDAVGGEERRG